MFGTIALSSKALADYEPIVGEEALAELRSLARPLQGVRVLHLSLAAFGTAVADMLSSLVPLMSDLGLPSRWQVLRPAQEFFAVNKAMYEALAGVCARWNAEMEAIWQQYTTMNAELFAEEFDLVVVHDPQPSGILSAFTERHGRRPSGRWLWHCHLDLGEAQPDVWRLMHRYCSAYDALAFDLDEYVPRDIQAPIITVIEPAIDPLGPRNMDLPPETVTAMLERYGLDPSRPIVCQISPFDRWHDPLGLIEAYESAEKQVPGLQLALVATYLAEEPEMRGYYEQVARRAEMLPDVFVLSSHSSLQALGNVELNAFQRAAFATAQKSIRKGFWIMASDVLWKERPVVASPLGGIPRQVIDGQTGYLARTTDEFAQRIVELHQHPELVARLGQAGRRHVQDNFLITRYLRDYLSLFRQMLGSPVA
jgi:trehalose synthase